MFCLSAFIASLFFWNLLIAPAWAANSITPDQMEKTVDQIMSTELEKLHIPGAAVVVTQGDQIYFSKGYGYADLEQKTAFDPTTTIVPVGSLTKSFSATAAMQLVEQNKLDLNQDVNNYLKSYKASQFQNQPLDRRTTRLNPIPFRESRMPSFLGKQNNQIMSHLFLLTYLSHSCLFF
ncbi:class A beta-lactamase-related serine hydrolase, partial [Paenibacillus sp. 28ISP30-2]|nr:class A beta-lactamase-related serine hydrolase [Paenibacillus sp. 28ISP30-2]